MKCTRISLDFIKRYVQSSSKYMSDLSHDQAKIPLFKVRFGEGYDQLGDVDFSMVILSWTWDQ